MAVVDVQCDQRVFGRMLGPLMEYIFLGDEIGLSTRVEKCFEKTRTRRMWDCVVVVKPQTLRKGKMLLEVSLPLLNVVRIWGFGILDDTTYHSMPLGL